MPSRAFHFVYDYEFWRTSPELRTHMLPVLRHPGLERIAGSRAVAAMLSDAGSNAIATVPCGVDLKRWHHRADVQQRDLLVGFPLRDEPHKGMQDASPRLTSCVARCPAPASPRLARPVR